MHTNVELVLVEQKEVNVRSLEQPLPIFRLQTGELRVQIMGGSPQGFARIAFMTEEGITIGDTTFSAWSPESWELLKKLIAQVETDFETALRSEEHTQWAGKDNIDSPNIDFSQKDNWEFT